MSKVTISEKDLFVPMSEKDIRMEYSELKGVKEFEGLGATELKFCWFCGCFFVNIQDEPQRYAMALAQSGLKDILDYKDFALYSKGTPPGRVKNAITKFKSFNISSRLEARFISENILKNYRQLSATDVSDVGIMKVNDKLTGVEIGTQRDWNQVSAFVTAMGKIAGELPDLIQKTEEGFGLRASFNDVSISKNIRDDYVQRKHEK